MLNIPCNFPPSVLRVFRSCLAIFHISAKLHPSCTLSTSYYIVSNLFRCIHLSICCFAWYQRLLPCLSVSLFFFFTARPSCSPDIIVRVLLSFGALSNLATVSSALPQLTTILLLYMYIDVCVNKGSGIATTTVTSCLFWQRELSRLLNSKDFFFIVIKKRHERWFCYNNSSTALTTVVVREKAQFGYYYARHEIYYI